MLTIPSALYKPAKGGQERATLARCSAKDCHVPLTLLRWESMSPTPGWVSVLKEGYGYDAAQQIYRLTRHARHKFNGHARHPRRTVEPSTQTAARSARGTLAVAVPGMGGYDVPAVNIRRDGKPESYHQQVPLGDGLTVACSVHGHLNRITREEVERALSLADN
jgi:hypothetical protein